ncbi:MAG: pre-peptidase C-terminal domain-containing protein [Methanobacteriota archaeon]
MLAISLLGAIGQYARATNFEITYTDGIDAGIQRDVDIISLRSTVQSSNIIISLKVDGNINSGNEYEYYIWAGDSQYGGLYAITFIMSGNIGVLTYDGNQHNDGYTVSGDTLTITVPQSYLSSAQKFDVMAEAQYMVSLPFEIDEVGGDVWAGSYDFAVTEYISVPGTDTYYLFAGDSMVYDLTLTSSVATTITLDVPAGSNFDMFLFNSLNINEPILSSENPSSSDETISFTSPISGRYYVVVDSISGGGTYTLTITTGTSGGGSTGFEKTTPDTVPWTVGDYAASGAYLDLAGFIDEMKAQMTEDMPDGVKASISGSGGIGQYILVEYAGEEAGNYRFDYSCRIYAALAVDGKMTADNVDLDGATMDGTISGNADVTADLLYEGSLWLGYYENSGGKAYWAGEKMTLNIAASLDLSANLDANIKAEGVTITGSVDASATADMDLQLTLESAPGIPFMPAKDEDISVERTCTVGYDGNVKFDMVVDMSATGYFDQMMGEDITLPDPVHVDEAASGEFTNTFALNYVASTNQATAPPLLNGGWGFVTYVDEVDLSGIGGTRATGFETTATYDPAKGMYTTYEPYFGPVGDMTDTEIPFVGSLPDTSTMDMTLEPVDKADAESFNDDPSAFLEDEGVSMPSGSSFPWLMVVLALVAVAVVVVLVVLMLMMKKKKAAKFNQHPAPYQGQQPYGQQPYQQPPQPGQYPPPQEQYPPQQPPQYPQQ